MTENQHTSFFTPRVKRLVKLLVAAACFILIARQFDVAAWREAFQAPRWPFLVLAMAMVWCEPVVAAVKWRLLLCLGPQGAPRLPLLIKVIFTSNFLSLMAPTAMGADALRLFLLRRHGHRVTHTMSALLADRVLGMAMLFVLAMLGWWNARGVLEQTAPLHHAIPAAGLLALLAIVLSFLPVWLTLPGRVRRRFPALQLPRTAWARTLGRLADGALELLRGFQSFRRYPAALARGATWNLLMQLLRILQVYFLFHALRSPVPFLQTLTFVPLIVMVAMLPVSFYGLGVKEGAFWFLFAQVGVAREVSLTVSLLTYPLILSALLPGAWFFLRDGDGLASRRPDDKTE